MIQPGTGAAFRSRARFAGSADVSSALSAKREIVLRSILAKTRPAILSARCGRDVRAPSREGFEFLYLLVGPDGEGPDPCRLAQMKAPAASIELSRLPPDGNVYRPAGVGRRSLEPLCRI